MPNVIRIKPATSIQTFGDTCGRCGGSGRIATLAPNQEAGLCPVCKGSGTAQVFESFGNRSSNLPGARFADGVQVTSTPPRTSRRR
jgi:hypothetical protein